mgnify:CR=1 FL=1
MAAMPCAKAGQRNDGGNTICEGNEEQRQQYHYGQIQTRMHKGAIMANTNKNEGRKVAYIRNDNIGKTRMQ